MACIACEFFSTHTSQCQARFCWWKVSFKGKVMLVKVFWKFIHIRNHLILLVSTNNETEREREGSIESFWYIRMCISLHYRSKTIKLRYLENLYFSSRNFTHSNNHAQAYVCLELNESIKPRYFRLFVKSCMFKYIWVNFCFPK